MSDTVSSILQALPLHAGSQQPAAGLININNPDPKLPALVISGSGNANAATFSLMPTREHDPRNLIVNYIPTFVTDEELRKLFDSFGTIVSARVIVDRVTYHPKGYGFVKYTTEEAAKKAMASMNGYEIGSKRLRVTQANGPQDRSLHQSTERLLPKQQSALNPSYTACNTAGTESSTRGLSFYTTALQSSSPLEPSCAAPSQTIMQPQFVPASVVGGQSYTLMESGNSFSKAAAPALSTVMITAAPHTGPAQQAFPGFMPPKSPRQNPFVIEMNGVPTEMFGLKPVATIVSKPQTYIAQNAIGSVPNNSALSLCFTPFRPPSLVNDWLLDSAPHSVGSMSPTMLSFIPSFDICNAPTVNSQVLTQTIGGLSSKPGSLSDGSNLFSINLGSTA